jgi:hypothetical protein
MESTGGYLSSSLSLLNNGNVSRRSEISSRTNVLARIFFMLADRIVINRLKDHRGDIMKKINHKI